MKRHTRDIATASKSPIVLRKLGPDELSAVDRLLREFSRRGWRDVDGAASAVVDALSARGGRASKAVVLRSVPGDFFIRNRLTRAQLGRLLDSFVDG